MFQFPSFPSLNYVFIKRSHILHMSGFPIRKSADRSLFAAPRSLSQLVTSFVGSQCQGILHMLFFAWTTFCISGDILSVLVFLAWIAVFHTCSLRLFIVFGKIVSFYPFTEKPDFNWFDWFLVSLYFFCHVCHIHSFKESICHFSYSVFNEHSLSLILIKLVRHSILSD